MSRRVGESRSRATVMSCFVALYHATVLLLWRGCRALSCSICIAEGGVERGVLINTPVSYACFLAEISQSEPNRDAHTKLISADHSSDHSRRCFLWLARWRCLPLLSRGGGGGERRRPSCLLLPLLGQAAFSCSSPSQLATMSHCGDLCVAAPAAPADLG